MYKKISLGKGKTRDEHRLIMERAMGRTLGRYEIVHHIDEDKRNNSIGNLQVMTLAEHGRLHGRGFTPEQQGIGNRGKIGAANALFKLNSEQVIEVHLLIGTTSNRKIAALYDVTHAVIDRIKNRLPC